MKLYLQVCGAVLIALILILTLGSKGKDYAALVTLALCAMGCLAALRYLEPVLDFIRQLEQIGGLDSAVVSILLKATGIGLIAEIGAMICADSGSGSLGKLLQILGSSLVLWLSLPLFTMLLELIQRILGEI